VALYPAGKDFSKNRATERRKEEIIAAFTVCFEDSSVPLLGRAVTVYWGIYYGTTLLHLVSPPPG
jgi:hypothetical protein